MSLISPRLKAFSQALGMEIVQRNGQRHFGPPYGERKTPPPGTEIFVAHLPRGCTELDIFPIFSSVGRIHQIRLMMDFSGTNRGYCYVRYYTRAEADWAIYCLNGLEISPGWRIGVVKSVDNCRLYFGGIPWDLSQGEIGEEISRMTEGVTNVNFVKGNPLTKRFCFVTFNNHRTASIVRRNFLVGKLNLWGGEFTVDWAKPKEWFTKK